MITVNPNLFAFTYCYLKIPLNSSSSTCFSPSLTAANREKFVLNKLACTKTMLWFFWTNEVLTSIQTIIKRERSLDTAVKNCLNHGSKCFMFPLLCFPNATNLCDCLLGLIVLIVLHDLSYRKCWHFGSSISSHDWTLIFNNVMTN